MNKGKTYKQILALDRAIRRVRDTQNALGQMVPGCVFPSSIMFANAFNQMHLKASVDGILDGAKPIRFKYQKDEKWVEGGFEKFLKEEEKFLETIDDTVSPKEYLLSELSKIDTDEYLKKANENTPIPQEYFSLLMEAGVLIDDTKDK